MGNEENEQESNKKQNKQTKKVTKKIISAIMQILVAILIAILVASAVFSIISQVVDSIKNIGQSIINFFLGDENGIEITDTQIDSIISTVESMGIDYDDLGLLGNVDYSAPDVEEQMKQEKRKYTRMFLEAQIVTQELNKRR